MGGFDKRDEKGSSTFNDLETPFSMQKESSHGNDFYSAVCQYIVPKMILAILHVIQMKKVRVPF